MTTFTEVLLWTSAGLIFYTYAAYPAGIAIAATLFGSKRTQPEPPPEAQLPSVSLIIAAYNEEETIAARIQNGLDTEYPPSDFELVIGSDGSSDRTNEIVREFPDDRVRLLDFKDRGGKASVLNRAVPEAGGEVLVFSDANTMFEPNAVRELIAALLQPGVIVACGRLLLVDPQGGQNVDGLYWRYETAIKRAEGRLGAVLGANGAIYAIRREHYTPLPAGTIVDDFMGPLLAKLKHGGKIVYQRDAVAYEETPARIRSEFSRRVRIGTGNFQSIPRLWRLLLPLHGWTALAFFSHKVLRWLAPFLMVMLLATNLILAKDALYAALLVGQLLFYACAAAGAFVTGGGIAGKCLRLATMFTSMNAALAVGCWRWLRGGQSGVWGRTVRTA